MNTDVGVCLCVWSQLLTRVLMSWRHFWLIRLRRSLCSLRRMKQTDMCVCLFTERSTHLIVPAENLP